MWLLLLDACFVLFVCHFLDRACHSPYSTAITAGIGHWCRCTTCSRQRSMSVLPTRAAVTRGGSSQDSKLKAEQSRRKKTKLRLWTLAPHASRKRTSGRLRAVTAWNRAVLRSFDDWSTSIGDDELRTSCSTSWIRPLRQALTNFSCSSVLGRPLCLFCAHHNIMQPGLQWQSTM